jgi:hypothetical protein
MSGNVLTGILQRLGENSSQCHSVHIVHMEGPKMEHGPTR